MKMKIFKLHQPFNAQDDTGGPFHHQNFNSILRRDHQKNFLWASRLWVGRRKEPILGYVPKNDEKKNSVHKGLMKMKIFKLHQPFNAQDGTGGPFHHQNFNSILRRDHQKNFLWASRLWVGRRKEPILGYVPKNDEKKNSVHKGLMKMKIFKLHQPFNAQDGTGGPFHHQNFNSILRRDHQKNFLWASRLWVGRRKEPILGYVPKNDEKKNSVHKGLMKMKIFKLHLSFNAQDDTGGPFHQNFNSILRRDHQKNFLWASRLWVGRRKEPILGQVNSFRKNRV